MTGSYLGTGVTRGDAPSVRISGVTRGDDGLQARFGFWHSQILEGPTTEPEFKARVGCRVLLSYAALADLLMNEKRLRAISGPDQFFLCHHCSPSALAVGFLERPPAIRRVRVP